MMPDPVPALTLVARIACLAAAPALVAGGSTAVAAAEPLAPSPGQTLPGAAAPVVLSDLVFEGGSEDDHAFARAAAGLIPGQPARETDLPTALAAIRRTDRFRRVDGEWTPGPGSAQVKVRLDPWPAVARLEWRGDARAKAVRKLLRGLRKGMRPGELRMAEWSRDLRVRLVEAGYPEAKVAWTREDGDRTLAVTVTTGAGAVLREVLVEGNPAPYSGKEIVGFTGLVPGRTLWTPSTQQQTLRELRKVFQRHQRYEAQVRLAWDGAGTLRVNVTPGPRVTLVAEGDWLGVGTRLKDLVPLLRSDRYSPELLDEGDRRITRFFRNKGYLEAQVGHRREVTRSDPDGFQEVTITYTIHHGERTRLDGVRFEGNKVLPEAELRKAAALPSGLPTLGGPRVTPDLLDALEERVKSVYMERGYTDVSLRRQLETSEGRTVLVFRVREGLQRLAVWVRLELPAGGFGDPWRLAECLPLLIADAPEPLGPVLPDQNRTYVSVRGPQAGLQGVLARVPAAADAPVVFTLTLSRPVPLLKGDLTRVFTAIRQQRLPSLGVVRPQVRLSLEPEKDGVGVRIEVPPQPMETIRRLVVSGSDKTRADAVLREVDLTPGAPLDADRMARSQARLGNLGAFQRVDLASLAEAETALEGGREAPPAAPEADAAAPGADAAQAEEPGGDSVGKAAPRAPAAAGPVAWKPGDLKLTLEERPPYVLTSSFGYDKSQGYHVGLGVQQLNVGGMGRTIDYGIRAGNGTINNPTLARIFPTGTYDRSVDSFTVGYTDPWFAPGLLRSWLPDRTQYRAEAAYIQENQAIYLLHRRRVMNTLQWPLGPRVSFQLGHRWERVDVAAAIPGVSAEELAVVARYPDQVVISAPFAQVARDTRDNPLDPTSGMFSAARVEFANQLFLTSRNSSFVKLDLRNQWTWPVGYKASAGVVALGLRMGVAKPTAASAGNLPLSERFFAGGPFSFRGVEPDALGVQTRVTNYANYDPNAPKTTPLPTYSTPVGGQGLALVNLEYRFPFLGKSVWGEIFVDSGQVYENFKRQEPTAANPAGTSAFPPFRTALGFGLIFKIGVPLKIEYAADVKRILGRPRTQDERDTQLKSLLVSMGFQF
jgi:outer membrane protein assembly factor BamA